MPDNIYSQDDEGDLDVPTGPMPGEGGTPAQPPEEGDEALPSDHPAFDAASNIDAHEEYDEGSTNATGYNDQHVESDPDEGRVA